MSNVSSPEDELPLLPLLQQRAFRMLIFARVSSRVAQYSLSLALLLLIVDATGRAFFSSLLVLSLVLPTTAAGLVAGALSDRFPKRLLMASGHIARATLCFLYAQSGSGAPGYFLLAALLSLLTPFATAAEAATLPAVVKRSLLARANAVSQASVGLAQLTGFGLVTPVLLRLFDSPRTLFFVAGLLFALAAVYAVLIGRIPRAGALEVGGPAGVPWYLAGWRALRADRRTWHATLELTLISTSLIVLGGLVPAYIDEVLGLRFGVGALVLMPGAAGLALGLRLAGYLAHRTPHHVLSSTGFAIYCSLLAVLAFANPLAEFLGGYALFAWLNEVHLGSFDGGATLALVATFPLGFSFALVSVAAQTVLNDLIPLRLQGRAMATQTALAALASSLPVLLAGAMADLVGVVPVLATVALLTGAAAVTNLRGGRFDVRRLQARRGRA